jgi:hypothetical protein
MAGGHANRATVPVLGAADFALARLPVGVVRYGSNFFLAALRDAPALPVLQLFFEPGFHAIEVIASLSAGPVTRACDYVMIAIE